MKKFSFVLSFLILIAATAWRFYDMMPQTEYAPNDFSTKAAQEHIKKIAHAPHYVGSKAHKNVKNYLVDELKAMGLQVETQTGYTSGDWGNLSKVENIVTKIEGRNSGKALMLLSHYDSNPHSSPGASDDGVGVGVVLEGVRSFINKGETPKNDIIVLFTDAEELGLNGAQLFVNKHPWTQNIGLVLNFEARGSGGPSYMLIETNGGNKNLIETFNEASPKFPVANSLAYSIYKMLPNDTDLTVFREDADMEGFNFAFIDDHFDYHTANDTYERLDQNTLQHQISYLWPLMHFYANADLSQLKSDTDYVYFDFPVFNFVYYPFSWIYPMLGIAIVLFLICIFFGIRNKKIAVKDVFKGFAAFFISLLIAGTIGYFSWAVLKSIYPQYNDILHGFTYNGHQYIAGFTALSFAICFYVYANYKKCHPAALLIAPISFWLILCGLLAMYLKGASFFIVPVYAAIAALWILINSKKERPPLLYPIILSLPALWIFAPLIQMFPVGLGLKMLIASCLLCVLLFGLLLPVVGFYNNKKTYGLLSLVIAIFFFISAHVHADFTKNSPHPTSLLYVLDTDTQKAQWATYNHYLDSWTAQYLDTNKRPPNATDRFSSKYGTSFSYVADAPLKEIAPPNIQIIKDTVYEGKRNIKICVTPHRDVNRLEVTTNDIAISKCKINGIPLSDNFLQNRKNKLLTHYISENDYTEIELELTPEGKPILTFHEASYDLLQHPLFTIPERPENAIPMPFVINDAILTKKTLKL